MRRDVVDRQLAGHDDSFDTQAADEFNSARLGQRHLRRAVNRQARRGSSNQPHESQVLDDDRIGPGLNNRLDELHGVGQLVRKNQRVERDVTTDVVAMQVIHHLRQFFDRKIRGPMPGVKVRQPEINGVGPVGHGGAQSIPIAGRGQKFRPIGTR